MIGGALKKSIEEGFFTFWVDDFSHMLPSMLKGQIVGIISELVLTFMFCH
jgi:hypothetical protein